MSKLKTNDGIFAIMIPRLGSLKRLPPFFGRLAAALRPRQVKQTIPDHGRVTKSRMVTPSNRHARQSDFGNSVRKSTARILVPMLAASLVATGCVGATSGPTWEPAGAEVSIDSDLAGESANVTEIPVSSKLVFARRVA